MNGWEKVKLGEICGCITDGTHQAPPKTADGIPFITISNIDAFNQIDFENTMYVPFDYYDKMDDKRKVHRNDILYSVVGSFGKAVFMQNDVQMVFQRHIALLRPDENKVVPRFLYYAMLSDKFYMQADAVAIGAAQRTITLSALRRMQVNITSIQLQRHIVSVLSAYDNLIDNYRRQIKLLEEAAQRLYKEWFVDLRFPGYEHTKIVDGVPEGWKKNSIDSTIELLSGYTFKSSEFNNKGTYKIVTIKNVKDGQFDGDNVSRIIEIPPKMPKYCRLTDGDILISLTGNVGRVCIVQGENYLLNQRVAKVKSDIPAYTYCLFRSKAMFNEMNNLANGAAQQNLSPIRVGNIQILFPTDIFIQKFEAMVRPIISKINLLNKEINLLAQARDRLLPKLMSGEIKV